MDLKIRYVSYEVTFSFIVCVFLGFVTSSTEETKRVVIIGAGAAGIAAATRLYENGVRDILVLEAENRIGGRVNTIEVQNGLIELGAQWIHGEKGNVVYELASARNLTINSSEESSDSVYKYVRSSGEIIKSEVAKRLSEILWKLYDNYSKADFENFKSTGEFFLHSILESEFKKPENADISYEIKSEFIDICHKSVNVYDGSDAWFDISTSTLTEFEECEGNILTKWNNVGYRTLFNILMEKSGQLSNSSFKSNVVSLSNEVERISLRNNGSSLTVKCSNGRIIYADHAIITVSIGVLKENYATLFDNIPLPEIKIRSINNLGFGTVDKIYLEFSKPWWPVGEQIELFLTWTRADKEEYVKKGLEWVTSLFSVWTVDFAPNVVCMWISGTAARTMESLDENFVLKTVTQMLRKVMSKKWTIPSDATRIIRTTWYSNKHFRGSYSFISVKAETNNVSASSLSAPINNFRGDPILLFAGEATNPHHYSTVHGAVESGWREADRLLSAIRKNQIR